MYALPVLMVTQDNSLWGHWQDVDSNKWLPHRGTHFLDIKNWKNQGKHLVFLDKDLPSLPDWNNQDILSIFNDVKVVVFSSMPSDAEGQRIMSANASGYAHKFSTHATLNNILQSIISGNIWLGRSLLQKMLIDISDRVERKNNQFDELLTAREAEVAQLASIGKSNSEIAEKLNITERTVRAHLSAIFEKLNVQDRLMLALKIHGIN